MLVVRGITRDGKRFRPSDWANMLVGRYVTPVPSYLMFGQLSHEETQECISISKHIQICCTRECCEIHIHSGLLDTFPIVYEHIRQFAITNNLVYTET